MGAIINTPGAPPAGSEFRDGDDHPGQHEHDDQSLGDEPEARHPAEG
jgi:hypothetical protein